MGKWLNVYKEKNSAQIANQGADIADVGLAWDEEQTIQKCELMFERQNKRYPAGALEFVYSDRPDLVKALQAAEENYTQAWHKRDMAGCRKALPAIEAAIAKIIQAYELEQGLWPPGRD